MAASHSINGSPAYEIRDPYTGRVFVVHPQPSDINACVSLSLARSLCYVIGVLLVLTDIPRTGLAVDLSSYFATVAPGVAMYYGPYAYPLVHLTRAKSNLSESIDDDVVEAFAGDDRLDGVPVWAYKYDTLSIQTRALAEHLNVSSYPRCLLYERPCEEPMMSPNVAFTILNDLMTAIQGRYFGSRATRNTPARFETTSFWCDRLHHIFLGKLGCRLDHRIHSVRRFATEKSLANGQLLGFDICNLRSTRDRNRPTLCSLPVQWLSDHPTLGAAVQVPIQENIRLRVSMLQQRYPDSMLEMMLITTNCPVESLKVSFLPAVYYNSENLEVTTLIRGRRCPPGEPCRVEFIDDYRYERATIETSSDELKFITGSLRAISQSYIWLRVVLLVWICCNARLAEPSVRTLSNGKKTAAVVLTLLRIPSHTIIYSSWLPVIMYSLAHFIDCGLVHLITDNFWASTNGFFAFNFVNFIVVASIQMRNIWFIALVWKVTVALYSTFITSRHRPWRPQDGLFAFRAVFIGTISSLTTLSFMPSRRFRNTKITEFIELPRHVGANRMLFPPRSSSMSDFGQLQDVKTVFLASVFVFGVSLGVQTMLRCVRSGSTRFFACHNYYVPFTAGKLFPSSALTVFWHIRLTHKSTTTTLIPTPRLPPVAHLLAFLSPTALASVMPSPVPGAPLSRHCDICNFIPAPLYWQATQGCSRHERIFSLGARSLEIQSILRLVNIGMLSDPIVFLRLRVLGCPLHLRRIQLNSACPRRMPVEHTTEVSSEIGYILTPARPDNPNAHELVTVIDSRVVPWTMLVDCG